MTEEFELPLYRHPHDTWQCPACSNSANRDRMDHGGMTENERELAVGNRYTLVIAGAKIRFDALLWNGGEGIIYVRDRWSMRCPKCMFEWDAT